jgi:predicted metallo-beta-lactamase superfamily hydrolase
MPHEECVNLIKRAGDTLALKVVTANISSMTHSHYQHHDSHSNQHNVCSHSLPYRRKGKFIIIFKRKNFIFFF